MARLNLDGWVPEERGSAVLDVIAQSSAVDSLGRHEPMNSDTKTVMRAADMDVSVTAKGAAYAEDTQTGDEVTLKARKFTGAARIAEEDLDDIPENVIAAKQRAWASGYAVKFDNATLGVTAAENGTTIPFTSVYKTLATTDAGLGYTADDNIVKTAGALTYDDLSGVLSLVEDGPYFGDLVVIANPAFRASFRDLKDTTGSPLFVQGLAGTPDTLFGYQVRWSRGARTNATASQAPTGNPLLIVAEKSMLIVGDRSPVESVVIDGRDGLSALTDETILKMRTRKGFALGHPHAAAAIEVTAV